MTIVPCPDHACDQPAEVLDVFSVESTQGLVEHLKTRCLAKHIFTLPSDRVPKPAVQLRTGQVTSDSR